MDTRELRNHDMEEGAEPEHSTRPEGVKVFETDAWIPNWEQSIPGQRLVLAPVPASCNLYLEPEPHFAIEINLEGQVALKYHRLIAQQGEQIPMQFEGLQYDNYPIRGNNYNTLHITNNKMYRHATYRLLDKGLRLLRITDAPTAEVRGFVINLAIDNYRPLTLTDCLVTLSPQLRSHDDDSNFTVTHKIKIASAKGHFADVELEKLRDNLRIVFSVINVQCCEIVLLKAFDTRSSLSGYMIDQLHCDPFTCDVLQYSLGSSKREEEVRDIASKLYRQVKTSPPQYLEALEMLTCRYHDSIPSFCAILEKTCGSGRANVRKALQHCVESTRIPSEYTFLENELNVGENADFIDLFYGMRNHFAHEKNRIARGRLIPPETHTIVKELARLLCWSKVLTDIDVKCLLWQEGRVSFADWVFARHEGQRTILRKFQADGTYNALAAMRRLLRGGETPRRASAFFETPEGRAVFCEATDWPSEMPER